jgi:hypothetical protein
MGTVEQKQGKQYAQDVQGIAGNILRGQYDVAENRLDKWSKLWAEIWGIEVYEARTRIEGDVTAEVKKTLPSQQHELRSIKKWKSYGKETYYKFGWGILPIDEAIARQEAVIQRIELF